MQYSNNFGCQGVYLCQLKPDFVYLLEIYLDHFVLDLYNYHMDQPKTAPALTTSDSHIFDDDIRVRDIQIPALSDEQIFLRYEIDHTIREIRKARFRRIALQFPDDMLPNAPRVVELMTQQSRQANSIKQPDSIAPTSIESLDPHDNGCEARYFVLGDTSYGACCVDEIAAEHIDADAVVHFGRACLSPTARLPSIYTFTRQPLSNVSSIFESVKQSFPNRQQNVILMADAPYQHALPVIETRLEAEGYTSVFVAAIQRDPESPLPNRSVPDEVKSNPSRLKEWHVFHLAQPVEALLLTLSSRVGSICVCPVDASGNTNLAETSVHSAARLLSRRYALITAVSTASIIGILINTLSVKNYLHIVDHVKKSILDAGKKSYTFVVGKVNTAKVSNFSEIDAWVVIGCWESSLITSKDFYKPMITPYELELALQTDEERTWTGAWTGDYQSVLNAARSTPPKERNIHLAGTSSEVGEDHLGSEDDSVPPAFDLRTGKYVSNSRPLQASARAPSSASPSNALLKRQTGEMMSIGGELSPGANYLNTQRHWRGLGSDFDQAADEEESTKIQEGHSGIASGYSYGEAEKRI